MIAHNHGIGSGTDSALNIVNKQAEDMLMKDTIKNMPEYKGLVVMPRFNCAEFPTYKEEEPKNQKPKK